MATNISHAYFGNLSTENITQDVGIICEKNIWDTGVWIWASANQDLEEKSLDWAQQFLENFSKNLAQYQAEVEKYLNEDAEYLNFHCEEIPELELPKNVSDFVKLMKVTNISIWLADKFITVDFMISPEYSDEILCLKLDIDGKILEVAWES